MLRTVESLAVDDYSEERLVREFWRRMERFGGTLVSFNGRGFDLPVLELAALRYGLALPRYFDETAPASPRHAAVAAISTSTTFFQLRRGGLRGGMDLLLKLIGMPGKIEMDGSDVQGYSKPGGSTKSIVTAART